MLRLAYSVTVGNGYGLSPCCSFVTDGKKCRMPTVWSVLIYPSLEYVSCILTLAYNLI